MKITNEMVEDILRQHIKVDATGLAPAVASAFVTGFSEAAAALTAALAVQTQQGVEVKPAQNLMSLIKWAHETLYEINPSNYDHDEVCKLNNASVEVILGLAQALGEKHGYSADWWEQYRKDHPLPALVDVPAVECEPVAWQTMDSAPKDGTEIIAAERWERNGKVRVRVYKYEGHPNYWHCREDGVCIRPEYQSRYVWTPVPAALSTRKGSAGDGSATGTKGISE